MKLTKGSVDLNDPELWLDVVFCKGNVLRMKLIRGSPPDDFDMFSSGGGSADGEVLESFEIYTLPGKTRGSLYGTTAHTYRLTLPMAYYWLSHERRTS
jgi:hypothetical protein